MQVAKHLKQYISLLSTLSIVRPVATLALFLFLAFAPSQAVPTPETTTFKTFAGWCLYKNNLSVETKHTVDVLLQEAKTQDCAQASKLLSTVGLLSLNDKQISDLRPFSTLINLKYLFLGNNQIADLRPLSTLTNLTTLSLNNNQITDLRPLSSLTQLTSFNLPNNQIANLKPLSTLINLKHLFLGNNRIADLKPLSTLTHLSVLDLSNNQITDLKPLSTLTNLEYLFLINNPSLTDKTCPVKPTSICLFMPVQNLLRVRDVEVK